MRAKSAAHRHVLPSLIAAEARSSISDHVRQGMGKLALHRERGLRCGVMSGLSRSHCRTTAFLAPVLACGTAQTGGFAPYPSRSLRRFEEEAETRLCPWSELLVPNSTRTVCDAPSAQRKRRADGREQMIHLLVARDLTRVTWQDFVWNTANNHDKNPAPRRGRRLLVRLLHGRQGCHVRAKR